MKRSHPNPPMMGRCEGRVAVRDGATSQCLHHRQPGQDYCHQHFADDECCGAIVRHGGKRFYCTRRRLTDDCFCQEHRAKFEREREAELVGMKGGGRG